MKKTAEHLTERNWYPKLLETRYVQGKQPPARNRALFKSIFDDDVVGENPLGTEKMMYSKDYDDL